MFLQNVWFNFIFEMMVCCMDFLDFKRDAISKTVLHCFGYNLHSKKF